MGSEAIHVVAPALRARLSHLALLCALLGLCTACRGYAATAPEGFAMLSSPFWQPRLRAVSPDGVMFQVRKAANEPKADLAFWSEALKKRMQEAGYRVASDGEIKSGAEAGYRLELMAPVGAQDYAYLVALFVHDGQLIIVESAGEIARFANRRAAVLDAIAALR